MKVGTGLTARSPSEIAESARNAESRGFDVFSSSETNHNPYLPLAIAAPVIVGVAIMLLKKQEA